MAARHAGGREAGLRGIALSGIGDLCSGGASEGDGAALVAPPSTCRAGILPRLAVLRAMRSRRLRPEIERRRRLGLPIRESAMQNCVGHSFDAPLVDSCVRRGGPPEYFTSNLYASEQTGEMYYCANGSVRNRADWRSMASEFLATATEWAARSSATPLFDAVRMPPRPECERPPAGPPPSRYCAQSSRRSFRPVTKCRAARAARFLPA